MRTKSEKKGRKLSWKRKKMAAEERERQGRYELRSQGIEVVENEVDGTTERHDSFRVSAAIKFVPPFSVDIEQFFGIF